MSLEEIKELIENKNIIIQDPDSKEGIKNPLEKLASIEKYKVLESCFGVGFSEEGTYTLPETLKLIKENLDKNYFLIPIK